MARRPTVTVLGCGRAGGAIALALTRARWPVTLRSRSRASLRRVQRLTGAPLARSPGDVVLLTVSDAAIGEVARTLDVPAGTLVAHASGGTSVEVLAPLRARGARIASLHPLQTLPDAIRGAAALRGAPVALTASPGDRAVLGRIARAFGGVPFELDDADKPRYHAAAVFASNYVVASLWAAEKLLDGIGPVALVEPLLRSTVENVAALGASGAITGPAARGDRTTVRRHLAAIADPAVRTAYRSMAALAERAAT